MHILTIDGKIDLIHTVSYPDDQECNQADQKKQASIEAICHI